VVASAKRASRRAGSTRTCVGCGRKAPRVELLRFVEAGGDLRLGPKAPGRGAYTCLRLACFERAAARRAFNRTLHATVRVDPTLTDLYTGA